MGEQDTTILPSRSSHSRWEAKLGTGDLSKGACTGERASKLGERTLTCQGFEGEAAAEPRMTLNRERAIPAGGTAGPRPRSDSLWWEVEATGCKCHIQSPSPLF